MEPVISVKNLRKTYRLYKRNRHRFAEVFLGWTGKKYYTEFNALDNISLDVMPGECMGIVGRNGSGKSTLLQCIAGTLTPTGGSVSARGRIGALLELGAGFNPDYTGMENIDLYSAILGMSAAETKKHLDEIIAFADIGEYIDQPVRTYSSGMYVRLAFAVNACIRPEILIIDEALSVGDIAFQAKCFKYLKGLLNSGTTILFVSHDTNLIKNFCHKAIWIMNGTIHLYNSAKETTQAYFDYCYSLAGRPELPQTGLSVPVYARIPRSPEAGSPQSIIHNELLRGIETFKKKTDPLSRGNGDVCIRNVLFADSNCIVKKVFNHGDEPIAYLLVEAVKEVNSDFTVRISLERIDKINAFSYCAGNFIEIKKLACPAGEFRVLSCKVPLHVSPGGYNVKASITGSIGGAMFDEQGRFDSNRQIIWHVLDFFECITVQCPVMFNEDVVFSGEISITGIEEGDKSGTLKAQ